MFEPNVNHGVLKLSIRDVFMNICLSHIQMSDVVWGQVDALWTAIFIFIIAFIIYWAVSVFTNRRDVDGSPDIIQYEYYEMDISDEDNLVHL
jgi:hypothetical protein